jgi:hypothetical protein
MSAAATTSAPTTAPDPNQAGAGKPSRVERLLNLIHKLIDYGKELATTLRQQSTTIDLAAITRPFGTRDITLILARITRGLHLANALEARLVEGAAAWTRNPGPRSLGRHPGRARPQRLAPLAPPTAVSPACLRRSRSPPRSAAGRSAPSSPISAAISASRPIIRYGGN